MLGQPDCEYNYNLDKEGPNWCVCNWKLCTAEGCKDYQMRPLGRVTLKVGGADVEG